MDFARSFTSSGSGQSSSSASSSSSSNPNQNAFSFNFNIPRIDLSSLSESLSHHRNLLPSNIDSILSVAKGYSNQMTHCESCGNRFSVFKRKKTCCDCRMDFCVSCITKDQRDSRKINCRRCIVFRSVPLDRNALMGLKVKDLKWYLATMRVSSQYCKEKTELVELIIQASHDRYQYRENTNTNTNYNGAHYRPFVDRHSNVTPSAPLNVTPSVPLNVTPSVPLNVTPSVPLNVENEINTESSTLSSDDRSSHDTETNPQPSCTNANTNVNTHDESNKDDDSNSANDFKPFNIDDLKGPEHIQSLNVRQLKLLLTRNFVDYKGCCEKDELVMKACRLWADRMETKSKNIDDVPDANLCKICMESAIDCVLLECGHMVTCTLCGKRLNECPICRQYVVRVVHIFKA